eukprot:g8961.t1
MDPNGAFLPSYGHPMQNQFSTSFRPPNYYVQVGVYPPPPPPPPPPPLFPLQGHGIYSSAVEDNRHLFPETGELPLIRRKRQLNEAETVFRLLLPESQLASVLNGSTDFQTPSGCRLRLCNKVPNCEERVIVISAKDERKDDSNVAMQGLLNAVGVALSAERTSRENTRSSNQFYMIRLLINRTQAGAVIGKGGMLNKEIKEKTGAYSKILNSDEVPACALHNDRVVQVTGSVEQVMTGMQIIAKQLRDNVSKEPPGGPPSCLTVLSGFTMYYSYEAPPYLPGTDYGQPRMTEGGQLSPSVFPPPPPPNPAYVSPRQSGYPPPYNRPSRSVYLQSPVMYTSVNQSQSPFNGGPPMHYR